MNYALVSGGIVQEIIPEFFDFDGEPVHVSQRYTPEFVSGLIEVPVNRDAIVGGTYADGVFGPVPPPPAMTAEQATARKGALIAEATARIAPLQDMVDLGEATPEEEANLLAWKRYRIALTRITSTTAGWPDSIVWPEMPA